MTNKRVKQDMSYTINQNGVIVLDNNNKYKEYIFNKKQRLKKEEDYNNLKEEVKEMKEMMLEFLSH